MQQQPPFKLLMGEISFVVYNQPTGAACMKEEMISLKILGNLFKPNKRNLCAQNSRFPL